MEVRDASKYRGDNNVVTSPSMYRMFTSVLGSERTIVMKASHSCHDHSKRSSVRLQYTKQSLARRLHCINCIKENHLMPWYLISVLINYYKIDMFFYVKKPTYINSSKQCLTSLNKKYVQLFTFVKCVEWLHLCKWAIK